MIENFVIDILQEAPKECLENREKLMKYLEERKEEIRAMMKQVIDKLMYIRV